MRKLRRPETVGGDHHKELPDPLDHEGVLPHRTRSFVAWTDDRGSDRPYLPARDGAG
jgi:hypothetical protein